ncbi:iron ABC transporter ATP-binding protein [Agromyces mediolanus]|uniref:iron ABC transporter ATP-binding protein n=1 Tax=Agromyces mediolanus TaxID=41986 RepID=UPI001E48E94C|nr:iron ABC transporter ATP-binding protein [Agromyces mediolanus]MCD1571830.1 iron ABC transporter ATP-binding protein [Agromyces mediolanus]
MSRTLRSPAIRSRTAVAAAFVAAAAVAALAGCAGDAPAPTGSPSSTPTATDAAPSESPTPTATETPTPFAADCDTLITAEQIYAFNPNFGLQDGFEPSSADVTATVDAGGTACGWLNQTSGDPIQLGVATPAPSALESARNQAASSSNAVPTYGTPPAVEGYFRQSGNSGEAQIFTESGYWIVIESSALFEPGDAQQLVEAVLSNLPA